MQVSQGNMTSLVFPWSSLPIERPKSLKLKHPMRRNFCSLGTSYGKQNLNLVHLDTFYFSRQSHLGEEDDIELPIHRAVQPIYHSAARRGQGNFYVNVERQSLTAEASVSVNVFSTRQLVQSSQMSLIDIQAAVQAALSLYLAEPSMHLTNIKVSSVKKTLREPRMAPCKKSE